MSEPFLAEIRIFPLTFAPRGWAMCNGQVLAISQNAALFSLIGTFYGGNGTSNFALPNLQGRVPVHAGNGVGLTSRVIGESDGEATVTLLTSQLPAHNHSVAVATESAAQTTPGSSVGLGKSSGGLVYSSNTTASLVAMNPTGSDGGNTPHNNLMPYLALNFCIALTGVFPARN